MKRRIFILMTMALMFSIASCGKKKKSVSIAAPNISGVVTTFAGSVGTPGDDNGSGINARFDTPGGITTDRLGNIFVSDYSNNTIRKITPQGVVSTFAGQAGSQGSTNGSGAVARFSNPTALIADQSDNIYVADKGNSLIRKITPAGVVSTFAGTVGVEGSDNGQGTSAKFNNPVGLAIDSSGNLFVTELVHTIRKITPTGLVTTFAGAYQTSGSTNGTGTSARFSNPTGITIDGSDNIFVTDMGNQVIRKITSAGVVSTYAGLVGTQGLTNGTLSEARFKMPVAIVVDSIGNLFIAEYLNHTVRKISPEGVVSTLAGTGSVGSEDGNGVDASFTSPQGIAISPSHATLYVSDTGNHTIRKVE